MKGCDDMAISDEKVSKFVQAITAYAEEQRQNIHREVEEFKAELLLVAEQEVLNDSYQLIQRERIELQNQMSREMSKREMDARKEMLSHRLEIMTTVFAKAKEKLTAFTKTQEYQAFLLHSVNNMVEQLPAEGSVYYLAMQDKLYQEELSKHIPAGSSLQFTDDIALGGIRGANSESGIMLDDTLDMRLDIQRDWFVENSGLTVE